MEKHQEECQKCDRHCGFTEEHKAKNGGKFIDIHGG